VAAVARGRSAGADALLGSGVESYVLAIPGIPTLLRLTPRLLIWLLRSSPFYHKVAELSKHKNQRSLIHEQSSPYPQVSSRIQWASDDDRQMPRRKKDDSEKGQMIDGRVRKVT
jgi:hypothetical protein